MARVGKLQSLEQIWPTTSFCMACKLRMVFKFLNDWQKYEEEWSVVLPENYLIIWFLLEPSHPHLLTCCLWLLWKWQSWVIVTEIVWLISSGSLPEKFASPDFGDWRSCKQWGTVKIPQVSFVHWLEGGLLPWLSRSTGIHTPNHCRSPVTTSTLHSLFLSLCLYYFFYLEI